MAKIENRYNTETKAEDDLPTVKETAVAHKADLVRSDLSYANLRNADLRNADLRNADLSNADLSNANLPAYQIPQEGDLVGWKALSNGVLAKLCVPSAAKRTASIVGRKCRAEFVKVLGLYGINGALLPENTVGISKHDSHTKYETGKEVRPDQYDDDFRVECTNGIHFWLTVAEAVDWV